MHFSGGKLGLQNPSPADWQTIDWKLGWSQAGVDDGDSVGMIMDK